MSIHWLTLAAAEKKLQAEHYAVLADQGSLTRRVRMSCPEQFEVKLINSKTITPDPEEREILQLPDSAEVLVRQVYLSCNQQPRIFARTLLGLVDRNNALLERVTGLGEQSLGSLLFRDPLASRLNMELACVSLNDPFFDGVAIDAVNGHTKPWLRRNLYEYMGCLLLVYEAFIDFPYVQGKKA